MTSPVPASLLDSNVWVAVTFEGHRFHSVAASFFQTEDSPLCLCRSVEQSWLRLITTPVIQTSNHSLPFGNDTAVIHLRKWLAHPRVHLLHEEPSGTRDLWLRLASRPTASPKLWMDAYLAAFAITGNLRFVTFDTDFRQFESHGLHLHLLIP